MHSLPAHRLRSSAARVLLAALPLSIAAVALAAGCGGGVDPAVADLVNRAAQAGEGISSYHMVITMLVLNQRAEELKTEELVMDIDGGDAALRDTFYDPETGKGTVIQELVRVGDEQYRRDLSSGEWVEEDPTLGEEAASTYTSHIDDFLANSVSARKVGEEAVNEVQAVHLLFELGPENVSALLPEAPRYNLEGNRGGQVDIWIDAGTFHPVRYELLFRGVLASRDMPDSDVKIIIDITGINGPVDVMPPA